MASNTRTPCPLAQKELFDLFLDCGRSINGAARKASVHWRTMRRWLREKGIPISPDDEEPEILDRLEVTARSKAYRNLACAVIYMAISDLGKDDRLPRESAKRFLLRPNASLAFWAKAAGLDPGRLVTKMRERRHR